MTIGSKIGKEAFNVAKSMGNTKSLGKCALAVGNAVSHVLGENIARKFRGNAFEWIKKVQSAEGKKYWKFFKKSKDTTNLPAGSLVIWDKQATHPYGHIEVADGHGNLCSDFIRSDKRTLYKSNPANIIPMIFVPVDSDKKTLPYEVEVIADCLNIRKSPSTDAEIVKKITKGTRLIVWAVETKSDRTWGKDAQGFFALEYTKEI